MKIPNIGNVMNKFEILGVVGEGKLKLHVWKYCIILYITKNFIQILLTQHINSDMHLNVQQLKKKKTLFFNYVGLILQGKTI